MSCSCPAPLSLQPTTRMERVYSLEEFLEEQNRHRVEVTIPAITTKVRSRTGTVWATISAVVQLGVTKKTIGLPEGQR